MKTPFRSLILPLTLILFLPLILPLFLTLTLFLTLPAHAQEVGEIKEETLILSDIPTSGEDIQTNFFTLDSSELISFGYSTWLDKHLTLYTFFQNYRDSCRMQALYFSATMIYIPRMIYTYKRYEGYSPTGEIRNEWVLTSIVKLEREVEYLDPVDQISESFGTIIESDEDQSSQKLESDQTELNPLVIRTYFGNDLEWNALKAKLCASSSYGFRANLSFEDNDRSNGMSPEQIIENLLNTYEYDFVFFADSLTFYHAENPVLCVDLSDQGEGAFRVVPSAMWVIENNLSIHNVDFIAFRDSCDADGIYRGFD